MQTPKRELILSFVQIGAMLKARKVLIACAIFASVVLAGVGTFFVPKTYVASADLFIDYRVNDPISGRQFHPMQDESYLETQFDFIKSVQVAERVINTLKLQDSTDGKRLLAKLGPQRGLRALAEAVVRNIEVTPHKNSRVIEIEYFASEPQHAKDVVNAIVKAYIDLSQDIVNEPARARRDQYNAQLENLSHQVDEIQTKLTAYQQQYQIVDVDERLDADAKQLSSLNTKLTEVQLQRVEAQAKRQSLENMVRSGNRVADIPDIAGLSNIAGLKTALAAVDAQLASAAATLGPRHPRYLTLVDERQALLDKLMRESTTALDALRANEAKLSQQEAAINQEMDAYQKKTFENKKHRDVIGSYQRQLESVQKVYNAAILKFDELLMTSNVSISNASVMRWAELPEKPTKPVLKKNVLFGLIAGAILGLSLAFLLELAHRKVRCLDDLTREFDFPVLAELGITEKAFKDGVQNPMQKLRDFHA
jgi:succinoglycan biosynthesis transport protein ExoP